MACNLHATHNLDLDLVPTPSCCYITRMGLALWLVPTKDHEREILEQEMKSLRLANAESASSAFPPHVTLIAGISEKDGDRGKIWQSFLAGLQRWRQDSKVKAGSPFKCTLQEVTTRGIYFQCVVITLTKNTDLNSLNDQMRRTFSLQDQPDYFPHCSLLYAPLSSQEATQQIEDMQRRGGWETLVEGRSIAFVSSASRRMSSITLGRIELWDCNGPVSQWKQIESVML